jgi:uncharacterized Zn finger protein
MNIYDFESGIDEKILVRGKKYFIDGLVADIWIPKPGFYCAVVEGGISYDVEVHVDADDEICNHSCDCPYDWGEYCKHVVAVLFTIRKYIQQGASLKRKGQKQGLRSILFRQKKETLVNLLCDLVADYNLRKDILYFLEKYEDVE